MLRSSRDPSRHRGETTTRTALALLVAIACAVTPACLSRRVGVGRPTTKSSFDTIVPQPAIDKIDLLVMVDNSASMADKQQILADAVPDLVRGLVQPKCVDKATRKPTGVLSDPTKPEAEICPAGSEPAFSPITDMHIGVLSSSLGGLGSSSCSGKAAGGAAAGHENDRGHLLARGATGDVAEAGDLHFLAWYPAVEKNDDKRAHPEPPVPKIGTVDQLGVSFQNLVRGVGQDGCGFEAQLESVYRFLVQPDPWTTIQNPNRNAASYGPPSEVDVELLRQRAAFLRPDSLVAVIVLTDEDDSSVDPLAFGGGGWAFMDERFKTSSVGRRDGETGTTAPRGTTACATNPTSPDCTSCGFAATCKAEAPSCAKLKSDPNCTASGDPGNSGPGFDGYHAPEDDRLNVRFHHMKSRFGVDPQFPISRYVNALTKTRVPRRADEHDPQGNYRPKDTCLNPLFAAKLPTSEGEELCALTRGPRSESLIYFALIGGVPRTLLPADAEAAIDWTKILGKDPHAWDETGIDPHMIQSSAPRSGLPAPGARGDADPIHGREWTTDGRDLQYACTFDLYERKGNGAVPVRRECNDNNARFCDCAADGDTPLCDPDNRKIQTKGKAYPTRRELMVVKELGVQGIAASLCPEQLTSPNEDDYGYRPAVRSITSRLERSLLGSCLPRRLTRDGEGGSVSCLVLAVLGEPGADTECQRFGLDVPPSAILAQTRETIRSDEGEESARHPICIVPQVSVPAGEICRDASEDIGFCYVEAPSRMPCGQAVGFTKATETLTFARFRLQCIEQSSSAAAEQ